jgi:iron complex transport system permease protein
MMTSEDVRMESLKDRYESIHSRKSLIILLLVISVVALCAISLTLGSSNISLMDVISTLFGNAPDVFTQTIVWDIRFPRVLMACVAGVGLAVAGVSMQGVMRNPLVSPFTLGISSGAALGAAVGIIMGLSILGTGNYVTVINAFVFAMGASLIILGLGRMRGVSPESFILVGIALTFLFGAFTSALQYIATDAQISELVNWGFGSLSRPTKEQSIISLVIVALCCPLIVKWSWKLNAISLGGDEVAQSLGVNPGKIRMRVMILSSLITAAIIAFTGLIGFVGLVAPHIARLVVGADHRYSVFTAALFGTVLLLVADSIGRTFMAPTIIPVGIMLSFVGAPFFLYLLMIRRREFWQ